MSDANLPKKECSSISAIKTTASDGRAPEEFLRKRGYEIVSTIASGGFGKYATLEVYRVRAKRRSVSCESNSGIDSSVDLACKVFNLEGEAIRPWAEKCLKNEMFISQYVKHENVVAACEVMKTSRHGFIFMLLCENGSIKSDLLYNLKRPYNDKEAKERFIGLTKGLQYLHSKNIVHRDLKLDNFLLTANNVPMIADFGFASRAKTGTMVLTQMMKKTVCGTKGYMAPELFPLLVVAFTGSGSHSGHSHHNNATVPDNWMYDAKAVDIYAMGICLFEMVELRKPFADDYSKEVMAKIAAHQVHYHGKEVNEACKDLIADMVNFKPEERPNVDQVLKHRWISHGRVFNTIMNRLSTI
ncbi:protein serine/threonine kinase [Tyrophagus putrescentiae]|nr:protein serine/threonine kinase [Tyrophagus putrescentiae]